MEPHDIKSRIMAKRPQRKHVACNITIIYQTSILISILALGIICISATNTTEGPSWPHIKIDGQVDNLISDDRDDSLIVTVNGDIFRYDKNFNLLSSTETSTSSKINYNETNHNIISNKILLIIKKTDSGQDLLFSCWKWKDDFLKCWLNKLSLLKSGILLSWPIGSKGFGTSSAENIKGLTSQSDTNDLLLVTSREEALELGSTNTSVVPHLPSIGRFRVSKSAKSLILEPQTSVLQLSSSKSRNFITLQDYVYLFNYNHYTHFILNENIKPVANPLPNNDVQHSVRIARICNNDTDLFSYTEISLTCNEQKEILAKHAYLDSTKREPILYVVYESVVDSKRLTSTSSMCSYSMKLIDDLFNRAVSDCNNGNPTSNLLMKYHQEDADSPPLCQRNPSLAEEWCTSKTNPYIDGTSYRYNVHQDDHFSLSGFSSINFIYTTQQGPDMREVIFIGTEYGHLTKMSSEEDLFYTIDSNYGKIKSYKMGEKFTHKVESNEVGGAKYTASNRAIMVTSSGYISRFDIDECYYYTTCRACLSASDPLKCVWCGHTCSKKSDCESEKQSTESCPPTITSFRPSSGPISGYTKLVIEGENLGLKGPLKIKLNEHECLLEKRLSDGETIECFTKPVKRPENATISVDVSDDSSYIYSRGVVIHHTPFVYLTPRIYGLYPQSGSLIGGTRLNVYGENLNAGSNRSVYLDELECDIEHFESEKISCTTRAVREANNKNSSRLHSLKVLIDGREQLIERKINFAGLNLSTNFMYAIDTQPSVLTTTISPSESAVGTTVAVDGSPEEEGFPFTLVVVLTILIMISLVALYVIYNDKIPQLKPKIESKNDKANDVKVSYRSPNPNSMDPINGLVKLNGSIMSSDYFSKPEQLEQDQPLMNNFIDNELASILIQEKILIDRNRLTLGHVLGSGQFGRVYKGYFKIEETGEHADVAVKTLHSRSSWDEGLDNRAFLEEGLMMKDFEHENVLALIGVTFDSNGLPMVITPFMLYGDLRSYISDEASSPTVRELIDFGTQIAKGMAYLSGLKFVHRDLAARNCMLDENLVVKVADFGLSRDIYERDYYSSDNKKTKLPVKWMAIESLATCIYNTKTDVWSYGVVLWELMTRGVVPYPDVDNFDLFNYLSAGRRMLRPRYCPLILYKIMLSCWSENPADRPFFEELVKKVSDVITQLQIAKDGQQKVSREVTYCDVLK